MRRLACGRRRPGPPNLSSFHVCWQEGCAPDDPSRPSDALVEHTGVAGDRRLLWGSGLEPAPHAVALRQWAFPDVLPGTSDPTGSPRPARQGWRPGLRLVRRGGEPVSLLRVNNQLEEGIGMTIKRYVLAVAAMATS